MMDIPHGMILRQFRCSGTKPKASWPS